MNWHKHILLRLILVALPLLTAVAPASAQMTVYAGQTSQLSFVEIAGDTYSWKLYDNVTGINFAVDAGNCPVSQAFFTGGNNTGPTVDVTWLVPGTYFFKITALRNGCSMHLKVGKVTVLAALPVATIEPPPPICTGDSASLNISFTGTAPWSIDLSDGVTTTTYDNITANPFTIRVSPSASTSYTVTRVSDAYGVNINPSNTVTLLVKPRPVTSPIIQYGP